ncbi:lipopolysaccharides biosynthesis glycosyltransferase [Bordetella trematum]|nr:lipopolysaccharides biosynthesis glycosyltransferase [Bordetella trematum]
MALTTDAPRLIRNIWYVHPYAGGPGVGRYSRPYYLSRQWQQQGVRATIITAAFHHLLDEPQQAGHRRIGGVDYAFLPAHAYQGNGLGRLRNMFGFSARLYTQAGALRERYGTPDLIIGSSPHPYAFPAVQAVARRFGAQSVFEVRDLWPLSLVELAGVSPGHPLVRLTGAIERHAYRRADYVVSLLPCTRDYMEAAGLPPAHWRYIPNGVHTDESADAGAGAGEACVQLALRWRAEGRAVVVYAGALGKPNHVDSLVKAIARLKTEGQNHIAAIIVGRGELQDSLRAEIEAGGLSDQVALFGQIPKAAVHTLLASASVGYISLRPEPLFRFGVSPNKLFDYMLAGLPVLFAVQAGNDPVGEAGCGVSVNPGDPAAIADGLRQLCLQDEAARQAMGQRGRDYVLARHSYEALAQAYLNLATEPTA